MKLEDVTGFLDRELNLPAFHGDVSNNGLQLEANPLVTHAVFCVDGSLALFEAAAAAGADFIFAHHGISWGANPRRFTGIDGARLRFLFEKKINLYAAHLPLDAHPLYGNNAELCRLAGLISLEPFCEYDGMKIGFLGTPQGVCDAEALTEKLESALGIAAGRYFFSASPIRRAAVVSGSGGNDALLQGAAAGADLLITGVMSHEMYHCARELKIAVISLGHYASETVGPKAVMKLLERRFALSCSFIDLPTGL